jgi:HEAT repeat protein
MISIFFSAFFLFLSALAFGEEGATSHKLAIESYLEIGAFDQAEMLSKQAIHSFPEEEAFYFLHIRSLSKKKKLQEALLSFAQFCQKFPAPSPPAIEEIAWAILKEGARSQAIEQKIHALLGAALSQDAKGMPILLKGLRSSNYTVRYIATQLAGQWPDSAIKKELLHILKNDVNSLVRQTAAQSLSGLQAEEAIAELKFFLENSHSTEEKQSAQSALLKLTKEISLSALKQLAQDKKKEVRSMAPRILEELQLTQEWSLLLPLLKDAQEEVKLRALEALAHLPLSKEDRQSLLPHLEEMRARERGLVKLQTLWLLALMQREVAPDVMAFLQSERLKERLFAHALLADFYPEEAKRHWPTDPLAQVNAALYLLNAEDHKQVETGADAIFSFAETYTKHVAWQQVGAYQLLLESPIPYIAHLPAYKEQVDQLSRIELLCRVMHQKPVLPLLKKLLKNRMRQIGGTATLLLLKEGDFHLKEEIEQLLQDKDPAVQIQTALILSLFRRDQKAVPLLESAYFSQERLLKEQILSAIGQIASPKSLPFLVSVMQKEPFPLKLLAASAALQCLYH